MLNVVKTHEKHLVHCINGSFLISEGCQVGYFGAYCAEKCNATCDGCNIVNGLCDNGCHPGWKGHNCEERNVSLWIKFKYYKKILNNSSFIFFNPV